MVISVVEGSAHTDLGSTRVQCLSGSLSNPQTLLPQIACPPLPSHMFTNELFSSVVDLMSFYISFEIISPLIHGL